MKKISVTLGIDIGGTNTVFGFIDKNANCLWSDQVKTRLHRTAQDLFKDIFSRIDATLKDQSNLDLVGIGVGAPNGNYYTGWVEEAPNLPWKNADIATLARKHYNIPTALTNDANAAAIAELKYGAARGMKHFIEITLGTGLGSGLVVDGKIVYGHSGYAGELGHTIVKRGGRQCSCGRKGCLETYVSATGLKRTVFELLANQNYESTLSKIDFSTLTAHQVFLEAKKGDALAIKAFEITGTILGDALANAVTYLSPEAVILFGGLVGAGDLLLKPTRLSFEQNVLNVFKNTVKIIPSALDLNNAAILGAGALIWNELNNGKLHTENLAK
ncbi:MAG TPA: ROK family protein [Caldithrix abyssi]|uniref:ROK family protein n=1 Tax=Caldithrix abyssi TaxID=187145 RepID=A0A7V4TYJ2_CALAY|nr:ROK family protein [Caldithrix abyssi]